MTTRPGGNYQLGTLADQVGSRVRQILQEECARLGAVYAKATTVPGDLVTETDFAIQDRLSAQLVSLLPESRFIGEEGFVATEALSAQPHWIVDPLDGTLNYASGLPFFGASIALVVEGKAVLGVVYDYGSDAVFCATSGQRPTCNGESFSWDATRAARAPIAISSGFLALMRSDPAIYAPDWIGARFRIFGAQAVQLCWAAAGRLRLNINPEAKLWDDAAGALICECAGAGYAALSSDPLYPLRPGAPALAGDSLFSLSGDPALVAQCMAEFQQPRVT